MIEWLKVRGYKCLLDVEVELGPFNVLVGRNDSGKSSLLQVLHESSHWKTKGGGPVLEAMAQAEPWPAFGLRTAGGELLSGVRDGRWVTSLNGREAPGSPNGHDLPSISTTPPLSIDPPAVAAISPRGSGALNALIVSRGLGTAAHLAALALGDRVRYEVIQEALRQSTQGRVREFIVRDADEGYAISYKLHDGTVIPAADASKGLLILTCFLALVHREDAPSVLLIEEPENGIHPLRLKEVVDLLRTLTQRGVQIFLTTHSPDLLSWCQPEEVLVFWRPKPDSGTEIHKLPKDFATRVAMGEPLGQIWASRGEEGLLDMLGTVRPFARNVAP